MANITIRDLPEATTIQDDDLIVVNDSAVDKRMSKASLQSDLDVSTSSITTDTGTKTVTAAINDRATRLTLSKSIAGGTNVTLTAAEAANAVIDFTGALTANINVIVPNESRQWLIINSTSGAFTLTVKTLAGTGVTVPQGEQYTLRADGTNVVSVELGAAQAYHTGNILGTVSQSGGVPTGAIIERGSNANGEYVKFADGTLICTRHVSGNTTTSESNVFGSTSGVIYRLTFASLNFPATFVASPEVSATGGHSGESTATRNVVSFAVGPQAYGVSLRGDSNNETVTGGIIAIGRWY